MMEAGHPGSDRPVQPDIRNSHPGSAEPDVTVVIPTRNRRGLLLLTLGTVLWQEGVRFEVVVVDDGSTDGTADMVEDLGDRRIRVLRNHAARGVSSARNKGIAEAEGRWIAFLDDDDLWAPDKLALQLRAAGEAGRSWAYAGSVNVTAEHRVIGGAPPAPPEIVAGGLVRRNLVPGGCSGVIVLADALDDVGVFDESLGFLEDWDLWIRLARSGLPAWVPRPLVGYRVHSGNTTRDTERLLSALALIEVRYGGPVDRLTFYRYLALASLRSGHRREALRHYARAAGLGDRHYLLRDFVPEVWSVIGAALPGERLRSAGRRGGRRPTPEMRNWWTQAKSWLELVPSTAFGPER
jgi:glycosyltransferase involved in cell wall biosynthesis